MSKPIVECIANYSEGRREEVIDSIVESIQSISGVTILDKHSDVDHNRSVITFAGAPERVAEAAFQSIASAAKLIDLDQQRGEHPRIGAADVVPFVPIRGITMAECVTLARQLGQRVGEELKIPVYLYEEAATKPERKNLENIRRGEYESLKVEIPTNPERTPDFGPNHLSPAGATVIGARYPLIAFNVYLNTEDLTIAKQIARAVRHSTGGLRYVKALEMLVDGRAQVSMNLTNYRLTPIARVIEFIRREAQRYGTSIHHAELVGLIPEEALTQAAVWYLQLDQFEAEQILEHKLHQLAPEPETSQPAPGTDFLDELAAETPTPGGGCAAAYTGAQAAALVAMVARLTLGKKKYAEHEPQMLAIVDQAEHLRATLRQAVDEDAEAYQKVLGAMRLPKDTPEEQQARRSAIQQSTIHAIRVPMKVAEHCVRVLELVEITTRLGNINALSDSGTAAALARAAFSSASLNVHTNAAGLEDAQQAQEWLAMLAELEAQAVQIETTIRQVLISRGGFSY